jgi:hypothetical protein
MKITITAGIAGQFDGETFAYSPGEIVHVPDALGDDLIRAGYAEKDEPRAAKPKAEKRVRAAKETRG